MTVAVAVAPAGFGRHVFQGLEHLFDRPFGAGLNPLRHLGSLGFLFFWLLVVSGIYLYAVLDTSATGAYPSIDHLSREQWYLGGLLRSIHRYAADGFIVVMFAHLAREWVFGRYSGFRRFSWLTGVPLLVFAFACGIGGFWLNWDQLGQFSAQATAEWLDGLPLFASPLTRNFLNVTAVSDRLFSLLVFIHLGLPLLFLFALWFHIQRISLAEVFPPRALAVGTGATLLLLALLKPVLSHPAADLAVAPSQLSIDWIVLFVHPAMYLTSPQFVWLVLTGSLLLLLLLPFMSRKHRAPVAIVEPDFCNGCRRCFEDCPYAAITMVPHPQRRMARELALVNADLCAGCGICVGACPSSTPFRSATELVTGIDLPQSPIGELRRQLQTGLTGLESPRKFVVFGCDHGADVKALRDRDLVSYSMVCTGMLPPSFVEYALRDGADGVLVTGCRPGGCEFRLGQQLTEQRLMGRREPHLRESVSQERVAMAWADAGDDVSLASAVDSLRKRVAQLDKSTELA
jgi:coenzyme F420-reducing hydrogenase delta subunit/quinol-cytochrome oxidoreductase complex cytochrome b subunit